MYPFNIFNTYYFIDLSSQYLSITPRQSLRCVLFITFFFTVAEFHCTVHLILIIITVMTITVCVPSFPFFNLYALNHCKYFPLYCALHLILIVNTVTTITICVPIFSMFVITAYYFQSITIFLKSPNQCTIILFYLFICALLITNCTNSHHDFDTIRY